MLETLLVRHCAPVLAGLKTANMFSCRMSEEELKESLSKWQPILSARGIGMELLCENKAAGLVYVYRKSRLEAELMNPNARLFLRRYGYDYSCMQSAIGQLRERLATDGFPHEIGLFLGYPLGDIEGFIENKGHNYKLCGFWKVYCNEECTAKCFEQYRKCFRVYDKVFRGGRCLEDMVVAG